MRARWGSARALVGLVYAVLGLGLLVAAPAVAAERAEEKEKEDEGPMSAGTFAGLALRGLGPAIASGRISDLAIDPTDHSIWYVAVASGGVWKTTNAGTTFQPIFDDEGSYSIGAVAVDPARPQIVWVGTGENNSQRSVGYGDGLYRSRDGGVSWEKVGLGESEHIAKIVFDPRDTDVMYVAAQGPLWSSGGDRGLYKSTDGGATWARVLHISDDTGVTDVTLDPRDPDVLVAAAYQRRRHVFTLIDGGPESGIHKSTDGGRTWRRITAGLPDVDLGRIGLARAPSRPDTLYAIVEAARDESGTFRSTDGGETWEKRSDYVASSPQYYQELVVDPHDPDRVYSLDTFSRVSEDGAESWTRVGNPWRHVDDHALWIDPEDTRHLVIGGDGGLYESYDRGATWTFFPNLPVTQFYKIAIDDRRPFYTVYGGTQDNNTLGGPTRTTSDHGITNRDWFVTVAGDGFKPAVDPTDPDVVYSQAQYGVLARYDRASGEVLDIQPQAAPGEDPLRWNWSSPLIVSPHSPSRLYYAAQRVFRSDDRGESWRPVSPDLTRRIDRNRLEVMGRVWPVEAVAKNASTSFYGNVVSLAESALAEGLLYVGTDDGLVQVAEDGGLGGEASWRRIERFPGVPEMSYVADLEASLHDADSVFAAFDDHKRGDFRPYLLRSDDRGRTWTSIAGDLPERGTVYAVAQDHVRPDLLFAGTEFGVYFTVDGGRRWIELTGGMPTIAVYDLEIQRRLDDLVVGTFGRGIYVLDDYSPLREVTDEALARPATLFPVRRAEMYMPSVELGFPGKGFQGDAFWAAPNPPFGAVVTYHLSEGLATLAEERRERETEAWEAAAEAREAARKDRKGSPAEVPEMPYPTWDDLRAESREEEPVVLLTVRDEDGEIVRRLTAPAKKGVHRVAWDLRLPPADPASVGEEGPRAPWDPAPIGPMVVPGTYTVELAQRVRGAETPLGEPQTFEAVPLGLAKLAAADHAEVLAFQRRTARLQRAVLGAVRAAGEADDRLAHLEVAWLATPAADPALRGEIDRLQDRLADLGVELTGDPVVGAHNEPTPDSIVERVQQVVFGHWTTSAGVTGTHRANYEAAAAAFAELLPELRDVLEVDLPALEDRMEAAGAPWTPGRLPRWEGE